jgi:hypothetical protein
VLAGALLLGATGVGAAVRVEDRATPDAGSLPSTVLATPPALPPTQPSTTAAEGTPTVAPDRSFLPDTLRVPAIRVAAPVVPTAVDGRGGLVIPENPRQVGWWSGGAAPGAPYGTTLLAGHVDSAQEGLGSLVDLSRTPIGATVRVSGADGASQAYRVVARRSYPKATLPWRDLFRQDVPARLLMVTCGGDFDRRTGHYERNVVVVAVPT